MINQSINQSQRLPPSTPPPLRTPGPGLHHCVLSDVVVVNGGAPLPSSISSPSPPSTPASKSIESAPSELRSPDPPSLGGAKSHTSIVVRLPRLAMTTHRSLSNATRHTASAGWLSSRISMPVVRSQILTRPSLPPLTIRLSSNWREVTLLSCAASRWIGELEMRDQTRTDPSDPPVTSVEERICSWPTKEVWPWRIA